MEWSRKSILFGVCQINVLVVCFAQKYQGDTCTAADKSDGICRPFDQCQTAREQLRKGIMPVNCGFELSNPIVCCPNNIESTTTETTKASRNPGERANYWCQTYIEPCPIRQDIAGGIRALPSEFPHMAAIGYGEENKIQWFCGGTLISDKFVMTAAHCLTSGEAGPPRWVLLGTELRITNRTEGRRGQIHPVLRKIRHPDYKPPSKYNDIALLEIGPAITPNAIPTVGRYLHPACLPTTNMNLFRAIATGWGRTGHGEDASQELLKVELNIFELSKCNETFDVEIRTTNLLKRGIDNTMLCAGVLEGGKDTCQGDSGGPLQFSLRNSCMYEVLGITSFGKICAFANSPAVYTRVSEYVPWIEEIVWP